MNAKIVGISSSTNLEINHVSLTLACLYICKYYELVERLSDLQWSRLDS